jgi:hypothetical protein
MEAMKEQADPVNAMVELPPETRAFLARLRPEDLAILEKAIRLMASVLVVGGAVKWLLITILGIFAGIIMFWESVQKIFGWFRA